MSFQPLYTAVATVVSGREGFGETSDGNVQVNFALPKEMGGPGKPGTTNPEQLFALGYASCFGQALRVITAKEQVKVGEVKVTSHVTIGKTDAGGFALNAELHCHLPGIDQAAAEKLVEAAHQLCPYSNATRGNIAVKLVVE
jgi:lipoyl-dependent peroxiredoxin